MFLQLHLEPQKALNFRTYAVVLPKTFKHTGRWRGAVWNGYQV